ncbi:probable proteasome activator complex subunit 4 [Coccomyxa sp. Obi]|nr:probable proteasome activator complex subunit 4 [Coccomyxa sp. Obi]
MTALGATVVEGQKEHTLRLVRHVRRFFAKEAPAEIWALFRPKMDNLHSSQAMEALGWLSALLPVTHVKDGVIDWSPHIEQLFTHIQWSFQVPVGTAVAQSPIRMNLPGICRALFDSELKHSAQETAGPRLIVMLLGRVPAQDGSGDLVMPYLQRLANLLESYYHPSNTGQWTGMLSSFLTALKKDFVLRINAEKSPRGVNEDVYLDEDGSDQAEEGGEEEGKEEDAYADISNGVEGLNGAEAPERRQPLTKEMQRSFAKDRHMVKAACDAIATTAYVIPDVVLPLVYERFQLAIESVTATHQLEAAVMTLSKCVRPLLLTGSLTPLHKDIGIEQLSSGEVLADAMMALLPGLDANDERKTCAVFRFYTTVLSSIPALKADQPGLPLPTEAWLEELLSLIFRMLCNLESPEARSDHSGQNSSFLLDSKSMYRPMVDLLFARLSPELHTFAIRKVGRFLATTSLPSMTAEASVLAQAAAASDATAAAQHILEPLLAQIDAELPGFQHLSSGQLSKVQEASLKWKVTIMQYAIVQMRAALVPYKTRITKILSALFAAPSKEVHMEARNLLSITLNGLTSFKCVDQYDPSPPESQPDSADGALQFDAWLTPRFGDLDAAVRPPQWYVPSEAEVAFAEELLKQHLVTAAEELISLSSGMATQNGVTQKNQYFSLLYRMVACIEGLQSCMPDFAPPAGTAPPPGSSLVATGQAGATVGSPQDRELVAEAVLTACNSAVAKDPEVLQLVLTVGSQLLLAGVADFTASKSAGKTHADDEAVLTEPALANLLRNKQEGMVWRRRRPRWLAVEKVNVHNLWRASQKTFRWWASTERLEITLDMISDPYKAVFVQQLQHSVHTYKKVRDTASHSVTLALKRYPCLTTPCLPFLFSGLANLPLPSSDALLASLNAPNTDGEKALQGTLETLLSRQLDSSTASDFNASAAEVAEQEALVAGVCSLLSGQPFYRASARSPTALAALITALLGSAGHQSPKAAQVIASMFITFSVGFIRPPALSYAQLELGTLPEPIKRVVSQLLELLSSQQSNHRLHWRYELMASAILMFLLPPVDDSNAKAVATIFLDMLVSQLQSLRSMATTAMLFLLGWKQSSPQEKVQGSVSAVRDVLRARPDYGAALLAQLTHSHPAGGNAEESKGAAAFMQKFMAMSMDEKAAQLISRTVEGRLLNWPDRKSAAGQDSSFMPIHAHLITRLADAAPAEMLASLKGPLQEALQGVQQDVDRPRTCASAEALSGLLACSQTYHTAGGGGGSAWTEWVRPLLMGALAAAPLEFGDLWAWAVRYGVYSLAEAEDPSLGLLLEVVSQPLPEGASSSAVMKRLKYMGQCLTELTQRGLVGACSGGADGMLGGVTGVPGSQVAAAADSASNGLVGGVLGVPGSDIAGARSTAGQSQLEAVRKFQWALLREFPALVLLPGEAVRSQVAGVMATFASGVLCDTSGGSADAASAPMDIDADSSDLRATFISFLGDFSAGMEEGTAAILAAGQAKEEGSDDAQEAAVALMHNPRVTRAWCALQFVSQSLKAADVTIGPFLAPHLLSFLPSMLKLQEVPQTELQPLSTVAKSAAALLKYLPLPAALLPLATATLADGVCATLWPTRAAALVFAQYFWFRHIFLLSDEDRRSIQAMTVQLLADKKLEVQDLAKSTLAGLIKGLPEEAAKALREEFLAKAEAIFPVRSRGRKPAAGVAGLGTGLDAPVAQKHATALGLSAFVLASPYDVPEWLPTLLLALVRAASQPAPIKTSVRKALAEFRRTHEEAALAEAKRALQPDQWDALQSVASPASYFA